jgi:hypothetical protein
MNSFDAVEIAEGFGDGEDATYEQQVEAWQYLIDTGLAFSLQGWFGRTAHNLIAKGVCHK